MRKIGWTVEDGRAYLLETYNKKSRHLLDDDELVEFWRFLENLARYEDYPYEGPIEVKQQRMVSCSERMLAANDAGELARLRESGDYSADELRWVWQHLAYEQKLQVKAATEKKPAVA